MMPELRRAQADVLAYESGKMGVSAVPGSGKTFTLSLLAADLIRRNVLGDNQEILIVTLVNSAVDNFSKQISRFTDTYQLPRNYGYRVRTLHGLSNDIVRDRPELAGLPADFRILDENEATRILQDKVDAWRRGHPDLEELWTKPDTDPYKASQGWARLLVIISNNFIRQAKDLAISPQTVADEAARSGSLLLQMASSVYSDYQLALNMRGAVDFDDLIRLALRCLQTDPEYLARLQYRWPYILEDEAQDSSRMQETILRLLSSRSGNWVRVGDPNQAIYETFTTADPKFLVDFLKEPDVISRELPNSGRSAKNIIGLANHLIEWVQQSHPAEELQSALVRPLIRPTDPNDPQPNPEDRPNNVFIDSRKCNSEDEIDKICRNVKKWLANHSDETAAILVSSNKRGSDIADCLRAMDVEPVELLRVSRSTRKTAEFLSHCLKFLHKPSKRTLADIFELYYRFHVPEDRQDDAEAEALSRAILKIDPLECYLSPTPAQDWQPTFTGTPLPADGMTLLVEFQRGMERWMGATLLPIDQLILTISQDVFTEACDLALAHKVAAMLERASRSYPEWDLGSFAEELESVSKNQSKISGFSDEDLGFDPDLYKGRVLITTIHKAKGLEWDRVYLPSANNYDFPSLQPYDQYLSEEWFVRDQINLPAEAIDSLQRFADGDPLAFLAQPGGATLEARRKYCAERLRLLFVGITRARRELVITWNTGRRDDLIMALPVTELAEFLKRDNR
jgi:DNA helicase-2/ATP-dependent DNA helicase PcrA